MRLPRPVGARLRSVALNALWLAAALLAVHLWQTRQVPSGPAPAFSAPAVAGQPGAELSLAQWRAAHAGRPVALHFWADWCPICRLEQGHVTRVAADWPVLTVALRSGEAGAVRRALAERGLPWAAVVDPRGEIAAAYGVRAVPALSSSALAANCAPAASATPARSACGCACGGPRCVAEARAAHPAPSP